MKAELKSVRSMPGEETPAFTALLFLDGKRAASVRSGGTGGAPSLLWLTATGNQAPAGWAAFCDAKAAEFHAEDLKGSPGMVGDEAPTGYMAEEAVLFGLFARFEEYRVLKRRSRTKTFYRSSGQKYLLGEWSVYDKPLTPELRREMEKHFAAKLQQVTFANDLF